MSTITLNNEEAELRIRRREVGQRLAGKLGKLEDAIQVASELGAEFSAELARAPRDAYLSPGYGQGVVVRIARVLPLLAEARGEISVAHTGLAKIGEELGVRLIWPFDEGDVSPYSTPAPKPPPTGAAEPASVREPRRVPDAA